MPVNEPTRNIDSFLGLRNREQETRMPLGALVIAENIDIDDTGSPIIRRGNVLSLSATNITASFSTQDERRAFIVDGGMLYLVNEDLTLQQLLSGFSSDYIYWFEVADFIFMSTGHIISKDNIVSLWRIPNPESPIISYVGGELRDGQYQIVITYVDADGREGAASDVAVFDANQNSGFTFIPEYNGYKVRAYVSDVNGDSLYLHGEYSQGGVTVTNTAQLTSPISNEQLSSYPAPESINQIAFFESKIYVSQFDDGQSVIYFSQPFWWNLFDLRNDHLIIPGKVTLLTGTAQGLVIGTDDEIYALTPDGALNKLADYGVPDGKPSTQDDNGNIFIHSKQGLCSALPFNNLTEDKVSLPPGDVCFTELVEQDGFKKIIVLTDSNGLADNKL